jgi:hypothetical protein
MSSDAFCTSITVVAVLPHFERDRVQRTVGLEDGVPAQELFAAAQRREDGGIDRFAVQRMRIGDRGVRESIAGPVVPVPADGEIPSARSAADRRRLDVGIGHDLLDHLLFERVLIALACLLVLGAFDASGLPCRPMTRDERPQ